MSRTVILHNRDFRGIHSIPVVGRSGKKYGAGHMLPQTRIIEFKMSFEEWQKNCWDIAQGGRRAGYTFYVADIIEDGTTPVLEPEPIISELKAETAEVQPEPNPFDALPPEEPYPEQAEPALPQPGEPCVEKEARTEELEGLSFRALRSIGKSSGLDVTNLNKSAQLIEAILSIEFP